MSKIILIPNLAGLSGRGEPSRPHLGLISLATVLKGGGYDVEIVDVNQLEKGASLEAMRDAIIGRNPAIVGFSTMCDRYLTTLKLACACKAANSDLRIVLGGPHATITDQATLEAFPFIDVIARGEYEQSIQSLVSALFTRRSLADVPGVTFRDGNNVIRTPCLPLLRNLDELPLPDYAFYPYVGALQELPVEVGRGCPFQCTFCSTNDFWSRSYRLRSTSNQIALLKKLNTEHGTRRFVFEHDNLTVSREKVLELSRAIRQEGLDIRWRCSSRIDCLDEELVEEMAASGCDRVYLGIESGSPRIQKLIQKGLDLSRAVETVQQISKAGMRVTANFIIGFPQETMQDLRQTIDLLLKLKFAGTSFVDIFLFMLAPMPMTALFESYRKTLRFDGNLSVIAYTRLTDEDRETITRYPEIFAAYHYYDTPHISRDFLLRAHYFLDHMLMLPNTLRILYQDQSLRFPDRFLEQLSGLPITTLAHYHAEEQFVNVSNFVMDVLRRSGFEGHPVHQMLKSEVAINRTLQSLGKRGVAIDLSRSG